MGLPAGLGDLAGLRQGPGALLLDGSDSVNAEKGYKDSKLCNLLMAGVEQRLREQDTPLPVLAWSPGLVYHAARVASSATAVAKAPWVSSVRPGCPRSGAAHRNTSEGWRLAGRPGEHLKAATQRIPGLEQPSAGPRSAAFRDQSTHF